MFDGFSGFGAAKFSGNSAGGKSDDGCGAANAEPHNNLTFADRVPEFNEFIAKNVLLKREGVVKK